MRTVESFGSNAIEAVAFSPDGKFLASAGYDGKVILTQAATQPPPRP